MKRTIKKVISIVMVLSLLLTAFAGCGDAMYKDKETTPIANADADPETDGDPEPDNEEKDFDPTRVFTLDSLEPLSKEKQEEVERAWAETHKSKILWREYAFYDYEDLVKSDDRYYGTYNDKIVIFKITMMDSIGKMTLAGQTIQHSTEFIIYVYFDGEFHEFYESKQYEWFSEEDLLKIVEYHNAFEKHADWVITEGARRRRENEKQ